MARNLLSTLSAMAQPALRVWDRLPIRLQGRITVGLPLVAVFISTCLALVGNYQRVDIETDIQRKFEMTAALGGLTTLIAPSSPASTTPTSGTTSLLDDLALPLRIGGGGRVPALVRLG